MAWPPLSARAPRLLPPWEITLKLWLVMVLSARVWSAGGRVSGREGVEGEPWGL